MFSIRLELQAAKQGEQTIRSVSIESDACGWRRVFEKLQRRQPHCGVSRFFSVGLPQRIRYKWYRITAALEIRWTGPGIRERWNPRKRAHDGSRPRQHDATKKKRWCQPDLVKSLLYWSGHIASSATASCPRCFFLVTPLRRLVGCFAFSGRPRTDLQRFLPKPEYTVCQTRSLMTKKICRREFEILAQGRTLAVRLSPPVSSLSMASNRRPFRSVVQPRRLPALSSSDRCRVA